MGDGYGDFNAVEPRLKKSTHEVIWGDGETLTSREDLIEAGDLGYDSENAIWSFKVIGSFGFPRVLLGYFVIQLKDNGELATTLE